MRLTGKIQRYKTASGIALAFRIVHNYGRGREQTPTNRLIKNIITLPENKLNDVLYQAIGWAKIEKALDSLRRQKILSETNAADIRAKFARRLPRPVASVPIAKLKPIDAAKERLATGRYGFIGIADNE